MKEALNGKNQKEIPATDSAKESCCCGGNRKKERSPQEYRDLIHRLNRIEGQVSGISRMVEDGAYCVDILNQVAAVNGALKAFSRVLLENHIRTCVREDAHQGGDEKLDELIEVLERLMK